MWRCYAAAWPSGKAEACKASIPSSILGAAFSRLEPLAYQALQFKATMTNKETCLRGVTGHRIRLRGSSTSDLLKGGLAPMVESIGTSPFHKPIQNRREEGGVI